jgi:hypothetical protein
MHDRHDVPLEPLTESPALEELLEERDHILITARLNAETQLLRATEPRADTKAGNFLSLASGLLVAGLALLGTGRLHGPGAVCGWTAVGLVGAVVLLLSAALRPNLGATDFGFVRWARTRSDREVLDALAAGAAGSGDCTEQARQLRWLSRSLYVKFARIRLAQSLLVAAFILAAAVAALTVWTR